jgi:integrase
MEAADRRTLAGPARTLRLVEDRHERLRVRTADGTWDRILDQVIVKDEAVGRVEWTFSIDSRARGRGAEPAGDSSSSATHAKRKRESTRGSVGGARARVPDQRRHADRAAQPQPALPLHPRPRRPSDVRLHDLRHTAVSLLLESGTPPYTVQAIARRADLEITLSIYAHTNLDAMREALDKIDWKAE